VRVKLHPFFAWSAMFGVSFLCAWPLLHFGWYGIMDDLEIALVAVVLIAIVDEFLDASFGINQHGVRAFLHPEEKQ
jgi:hypothetical protein